MSETRVVTAACPRVAIGATRGSSGKTFLAMGLVQAWQARGLSVAPFKKGPDYIDAAWLSRCGSLPCRNVDTFLMGEEVIRRSFGEHGRRADVALLEGNHGLFDGVGAEAKASTAEVAKLLEAPVLLLVDCTKATRTVAALVLGCLHMDPSLRIGGVVLNQVATARQEAAIRRPGGTGIIERSGGQRHGLGAAGELHPELGGAAVAAIENERHVIAVGRERGLKLLPVQTGHGNRQRVMRGRRGTAAQFQAEDHEPGGGERT